MSKRLTIIVPDHVAEHAQATGNASKWFAAAGMRLIGAEQYLAAGLNHMAATGITVTDDEVRAAGATVAAAERRMTPEAWSALRRGPQAYRDFLAEAEPAPPAADVA
jgi:hypothetical protein